jgi:hypothetical protein
MKNPFKLYTSQNDAIPGQPDQACSIASSTSFKGTVANVVA